MSRRKQNLLVRKKKVRWHNNIISSSVDHGLFMILVIWLFLLVLVMDRMV